MNDMGYEGEIHEMDHLDVRMSGKMQEMLSIALSDLSDDERRRKFDRVLAETKSIIEATSLGHEEKQAILDVLK
ncbi:MAG: hypothetical protein ABFD97_15265 [Syntrophobacter sp.]